MTARGATFGADEQNNIDIYKANSRATVNITSVVYERDFFFRYFPKKALAQDSSSTKTAKFSPIITWFPARAISR